MEQLEIQRQNNVAWVWFNREATLNAIHEATVDELNQAFTDLNRDESIRAIVLAGRGRSFCAGFDARWFSTLSTEQFKGVIEKISSTFALIENSPKPVIGAVQGSAAGAGLILATYCDFIIAAENAKFTAPEVKLSIFPGLNLIPRLERIVGMQHAKRILLLGEPVIGAEAYRIGLVEKVVPVDTDYKMLYEETHQLAEQIAALPPVITQAIKASFDRHSKPGYAEWEYEQGLVCWSQPEREASLKAFLNRSK